MKKVVTGIIYREFSSYVTYNPFILVFGFLFLHFHCCFIFTRS